MHAGDLSYGGKVFGATHVSPANAEYPGATAVHPALADGDPQGDLRRLIREYHWPQDQVYPTGPYIVPQGCVGQVGH